MTRPSLLDRMAAAGLRPLQLAGRQLLPAALRGERGKGLFFGGRGELPFGPQIASVSQLLERLLTPGVPLGTPA